MKCPLLLWALLAAAPAYAEDADCAEKRSTLLLHKLALATCLEGTAPCRDMFERLENARLGGCERASAAEMIETGYGRDAVLVEATPALERAVSFVVERHVPAGHAISRERIRLLQKQRQEPRKLRDGFLREIHRASAADRLVFVEVATTENAHAIAVRLVADDGTVTERMADATDATLLDTLDSTLRDLPEYEMPLSRKPRPNTFRPHPAYTGDAAFADIGAFLGRRSLSGSEWGNLARHTEAGAYATIGGAEWPAHAAVEWFGSEASSRGRKMIVSEVGAGVRRTYDVWFLARLQIGAGAEIARVRYGREVEEAPGAWVSGGAFVRIVWLNVGVVARYSHVEVEIASKRRQAGGVQAGIVVGLGSSEYF